jgi:hypothetical protein
MILTKLEATKSMASRVKMYSWSTAFQDFFFFQCPCEVQGPPVQLGRVSLSCFPSPVVFKSKEQNITTANTQKV